MSDKDSFEERLLRIKVARGAFAQEEAAVHGLGHGVESGFNSGAGL